VRAACEQPYSGVRSTAATDSHPLLIGAQAAAPNRCQLRPGLSRLLAGHQRSCAADPPGARLIGLADPARKPLPMAGASGQLGRSMSYRAPTAASYRHRAPGNVTCEEVAL
jgi:hypothetical protein